MWMNLNSKTLEKQYKENLSDFREWARIADEEALVYPENFGEQMSIDETALHKGELYTVITNKSAHGKKGALAALIKGTKCQVISQALKQVPATKLMAVKEITADFAGTMDSICSTNFMNATIIGDRFHAQQIVSEGVQEIRTTLRREAIDEENTLIVEVKKEGKRYSPVTYSNGDTRKQLLARGRYLLFKPKSKWTLSQAQRADILFKNYPSLLKAYNLSMNFRSIFENAQTQGKAIERMKSWLEKISRSSLPTMISAGNTIDHNFNKIINYFPNGTTNASAESFNAKLKGFRAVLRGVSDIKFFLYRIEKLYA